MNRILLPSSLPVCAAIIDAHEKGISNSEIYHVSNFLDQLDKGRNLVATPQKILLKMSEKGVTVNHRSNLVDSDLTRSQIAYAIAKHQKQTAAKKAITKKKNQKKTEIFAKLPTVRPSVKTTVKSRTTVSTSAADLQKRIKFSAPLKVITANVVSSC